MSNQHYVANSKKDGLEVSISKEVAPAQETKNQETVLVQSRTGLARLPDEIILQILANLNPEYGLAPIYSMPTSVNQVRNFNYYKQISQRFNQIISDARSVMVIKTIEELREITKQANDKSNETIRKINASLIKQPLTKADFDSIRRSFPALVQLEINKLDYIQVEALAEVKVNDVQEIQSKIKFLSVKKSISDFPQLGYLTSLILGSDTSQAAIIRALKKCLNLKVLELYLNKNLQDIILSEDIKLDQLTILDLNHSNVNATGLISLLRACPNVRELDLAGCKNLQDFNLPDNINLDKITKISLRCSNIDAGGLVSLLRSCPNVQELDLVNCKDLQDFNLPDNINLDKITKINLHGSNIDAAGLASLLRACPNIQWLNLTNYRHLQNFNLPDNINLDKIAKICLNGSNIDAGGLVSLLRPCPNIQELGLDGCENLQDFNLPENIKLNKITKISLSSSNIKAGGLASLLRACPNVRELDLICRYLQDFNLPEDITLNQLTTLYIDSVTSSLTSMLRHCPSLRKLDVSSFYGKNLQINLSDFVSILHSCTYLERFDGFLLDDKNYGRMINHDKKEIDLTKYPDLKFLSSAIILNGKEYKVVGIKKEIEVKDGVEQTSGLLRPPSARARIYSETKTAEPSGTGNDHVSAVQRRLIEKGYSDDNKQGRS